VVSGSGGGSGSGFLRLGDLTNSPFCGILLISGGKRTDGWLPQPPGAPYISSDLFSRLAAGACLYGAMLPAWGRPAERARALLFAFLRKERVLWTRVKSSIAQSRSFARQQSWDGEQTSPPVYRRLSGDTKPQRLIVGHVRGALSNLQQGKIKKCERSLRCILENCSEWADHNGWEFR